MQDFSDWTPRRLGNEHILSGNDSSTKKKSGNAPVDLARRHEDFLKKTKKYVEKFSNEDNFLERQVALLTIVLESIPDGVMVTDNDMNLLLYNAAAEDIVGVELSEMTPTRWMREIRLYEADRVTPIPSEQEPGFRASRGIANEKTIFHRHPRVPEGILIRVNAAPIKDWSGTAYGTISIFHDISERMRLIQQRDTIAAIVTHDVKNHLISEYQFLELLLQGDCGPITEEQEEMLHLLQSDSLRHLQMTQSLVEIYRYDVGAEVLKFESVQIESLILDCIEAVKPSVVAKGLHLKTDMAKSIRKINADKRALRHVILNLLGNAIKYTPPGGTIKVDAQDEDNNHVLVTITDTGEGIPESDQGLLFKTVFEKQDLLNSAGSTGLGLYLCRRILQAHNAQITCSSKTDAGTIFSIRLPAVKS
jgi:PAS domain S-box-containing protein